MTSTRATRWLAVSAALLVLLWLPWAQAQNPHKRKLPKPKLPKPKQLDADVTWHRDAATGEIGGASAASATATGAVAASPHSISVSTDIVPVTCSVTDAMGAAVRGLTRADFRVFDDGVEQHLAYFDASSEPASVALVMDASPSVLRDTEEMRTAARALGRFAVALRSDRPWSIFLRTPICNSRFPAIGD